MSKSKVSGRKFALLAAAGAFIFFLTGLQVATAAESGCITCHLNKEMLKKTVTVEKGAKSAMQSGAG